MNRLLMAATALGFSITVAHAQPAGTAPGTSTGAPPTASPVPSAVPTNTNKAPASGNANQAVVTTGASADQPAKGHNSFTMHQARHRIASKGYSHVTGLAKDGDGVWRGTATKDGQSIGVWLDYKGNVGQQS